MQNLDSHFPFLFPHNNFHCVLTFARYHFLIWTSTTVLLASTARIKMFPSVPFSSCSVLRLISIIIVIIMNMLYVYVKRLTTDGDISEMKLEKSRCQKIRMNYIRYMRYKQKIFTNSIPKQFLPPEKRIIYSHSSAWHPLNFSICSSWFNSKTRRQKKIHFNVPIIARTSNHTSVHSIDDEIVFCDRNNNSKKYTHTTHDDEQMNKASNEFVIWNRCNSIGSSTVSPAST